MLFKLKLIIFLVPSLTHTFLWVEWVISSFACHKQLYPTNDLPTSQQLTNQISKYTENKIKEEQLIQDIILHTSPLLWGTTSIIQHKKETI